MTANPRGSGNSNSTLVNTFNCINNNNININTTDNNSSSSSSSSGLQPIQDTIVQGLNGTLDGLSLNKTIINLCFINDNDNITIVEGGNVTEPPDTITCLECFLENLSGQLIQSIDNRNFFIMTIAGEQFEVRGIEGICAAIEQSGATPTEIFNFLTSNSGGGLGLDAESAQNIVDCLEDVMGIFDLETSGL